MNKYLKYIFTFGLILISILGCNDTCNSCEESVDPGQEKLSYISIKIDSAISTRIIDEKDQVFEGDNVIHKLNIYLLQLNSEDQQYYVASVINRDHISEGVLGSDGMLHEVLVTTDVDPGTYYLYIIANANRNFTERVFIDTEEGTKIKDEVVYLEEFDKMIQEIEGGRMVMTNANRKNKGILSSPVHLSYNTKENPAKASVRLDRLGAAVCVVNDVNINTSNLTGVVLPTGFKFVVHGFVTLNVQDRVFASQHWGERTGFLKSSISSDYYQNSLSKYARIVDGKVDGIQPNAETLFTIAPKAIMENNSNELDELKSELLPLQYATTGVIFRMLIQDEDTSEPQPFYTVMEDGIQYVRVRTEESTVPEGAIDYPFGMFYTYYIEDPNTKVFDKTYHAIVRNTAYKISLKSISQLGSPYPGGDIKNPEDQSQRIEDEYSYTFNVSVNRWKDGSWDIHL